MLFGVNHYLHDLGESKQPEALIPKHNHADLGETQGTRC